MAQTFADMHQMPLFETSAKDDSRQDHVEAIFMTLALKLKNSKPFYVPSQLHKARIESIDHDGNTSVHRINEQNNNKSSDSCYC
jgi:Ras-related protein Rab-33B